MNFILKENAEITQKESYKTITTKISSALYYTTDIATHQTNFMDGQYKPWRKKS